MWPIIALVSSIAVSLGSAWVSLKNKNRIKALFFFFSFLGLSLIELSYFILNFSPTVTFSFWKIFILNLALFFLIPFWTGLTFFFARENYKESLRRGRFWFFSFFSFSLVGLIWQINSPLFYIEKNVFGDLALAFTPLSKIWVIVFLIASIVALLNLESTFRSISGGTRGLWSFPLIGMVLFFGGIIYILTTILLYGEISSLPFVVGSIVNLLLFLIMAPFSLKSPQTSATVRFSRQTVYSSVVLLLVGLYFLFIGIMAKVVQLMGGNLNIFISVIAAFFLIILFGVLFLSPSLKKRLKKLVDISIYSGKYDFRAEWEKFSENTSSLLNQEELLKMIKEIISTNLNLENYSLFLVDEKGANFLEAFTSEKFSSEFSIPSQQSWLEWVFLYGQPVRLETLLKEAKFSEELSWKEILIEKMKTKVIVPLIAKRDLIGVLFLGPKKDNRFYTEEDFTFLNAAAHQSAVALLNARMSEALIKSKELESFHRLSTFVVHDLKNAVSMLSLLLQNAQGRMEDPEFQKSALFTVSDSVQRMQKLIQKLSSLPEETKLNLSQCDFNSLVKKLLERLKLESFPQIHLKTNFGQIPPILCDNTQMEKVLENLLVNAIEAMPKGGKLNIVTALENSSLGSVVEVKISDTGMGMSQEFIHTKLFQPFQTTKRKGLGIGLYQCKEMVESHQGKIKVESQENRGTTFIIELPAVFKGNV